MKWIPCYRLCVYVPSDVFENFITSIGSHIPSFLGSYDHVCWWGEQGTEQYRHIEDQKIERKPSNRVEILLPQNDDVLKNFITEALLPSHPWEEPVITIQEEKILENSE